MLFLFSNASLHTEGFVTASEDCPPFVWPERNEIVKAMLNPIAIVLPKSFERL